MVTQVLGLDDIKAAIVSEVARGISSPPEIIQLLILRGMDEDLIRGSIWVLIDQGELDLTWDLELTMPHAA